MTDEEKLQAIRQWCDAYPETVFTPMEDGELDKITAVVGSNAMSRMHASWARHILQGIKEILDEDR